MVLDGKAPDAPPHWELVFQIEKEWFGMDRAKVEAKTYPSQEAKDEANLRFTIDMYRRLVAEHGWAAVPAGYDPKSVALTKKMVGEEALVAAYEGSGVFLMPNGQDMMDFTVRLFERPEELLAEARRKCDAAKQYFARAVDAGADPPRLILEPWLDDPFPDYDTEPVMMYANG